MIAATLAATALLLGGCDKRQNSVDDNSAAPISDESENFGGPITVEDNMAGVRTGDNTIGEPAVNEASGNDVAANESGAPDR
jgi:hypothetical protein